jgi:hypothetical protein
MPGPKLLSRLMPKTFAEKRTALGFKRNFLDKNIEPTIKKEIKIKSIQKAAVRKKLVNKREDKVTKKIMDKHKLAINYLRKLDKTTKANYEYKAKEGFYRNEYNILLDLKYGLKRLKKPLSSITEKDIQTVIKQLEEEYKEDQI